MNHYLSLVKDRFYYILSMLAGELCLSCGNTFGFICKNCLTKIPYNNHSCCAKCAIPLQSVVNETMCGDCIKTPPSFTKICAPFVYEGVIKQIILDGKFRQKFFYFEKLFNLVKDDIAELSMFSDYDLIIPVPVSNKRLLERGYNQSVIIAKQLSKLVKKPVELNILLKNKETQPQTNFGREDRFANVKGVFSLKNTLNSVKVILVDDVVTTTATVREASKTLKKGGADEIIVFSLARARE